MTGTFSFFRGYAQAQFGMQDLAIFVNQLIAHSNFLVIHELNNIKLMCFKNKGNKGKEPTKSCLNSTV